MIYKLPAIPSEFELVGFQVKRGVGWRMAYWAWRLFSIQLPVRSKNFVVKLKP